MFFTVQICRSVVFGLKMAYLMKFVKIMGKYINM